MQTPRPSRFLTFAPLALAVAIGIAVGIGSYTLRYARGLSYLSSDPAACVNCHIMQPQFDAWLHSSHRTAAVCVDCHVPEGLVRKYAVKAENGWRHGKLFTTQKFAEPIRVQPAGLAVLQENCVRCHGALVHELSPATLAGKGGVECVHCHAGVGHGDRTGLGGPMRPEELEAHDESARGQARGDDP